MSTKTHQEYEQWLDTALSRVRGHLASGIKSAQVIQQCERDLHDAKTAIHALQGLAEIDGDTLAIRKQRKRLELDVTPLYHDILHMKKSLHIASVHQPDHIHSSNQHSVGSSSMSGQISSTNNNKKKQGGTNRKENEMTSLFSNAHYKDSGYVPPRLDVVDDMEAPQTEQEMMMSESRNLLMESQGFCAESEEIGHHTLNRMQTQREQLQHANGGIERTMQVVMEAKQVMTQM
jgi:hypothetical protein